MTARKDSFSRFMEGIIHFSIALVIAFFLLTAALVRCAEAQEVPTYRNVVERLEQPLYGLDTLGILKYGPKTQKALIDSLRPNSVLGVLLDRTFGVKWDPVRNVLRSGKVGYVTADLLNTTAVRNNVLQRGELLYGYTIKSLNIEACKLDPKLTNIVDGQVQKLRELQNEFPSVQIFPSLFLEHNIERQCAETIIAYARARYFANAKWIDNPMGSYPTIGGTWKEKHGNKARGDSISNDGESLFDANTYRVVVAKTNPYVDGGTYIVLGWIDEFNLRKSGEKKFIPPLQRNFFPSGTQFRWAVRVLYFPPDPKPTLIPRQCKTSRELKAPELWKPAAEDYGNGDPRGSKGLLIHSSGLGEIPILTAGGTRAGHLKYFGRYDGTPGMNRFYLGTGSGQQNMTLVREHNTEWFYLRVGPECLLVNVLRRSGYFRDVA